MKCYYCSLDNILVHLVELGISNYHYAINKQFTPEQFTVKAQKLFFPT